MSKHQVFQTKFSTWRQHHTQAGMEKRCYRSTEDAQEAAERHSTPTTHLSHYRCPQCLWWHIGRSRKVPLLTRGQFEASVLELGVRVAANQKMEILHPYGSIKDRWQTAMKYALRGRR